MADTLQTQALIVLATRYRDEIVAQINRRSTLLRLIRIERGGGPNCAFVAEGDGMVAEGFSEGADQANFGSDAQASCVLPWGRARSAWHISGSAMSSAATSDNPLGNVDMWLRNMRNAASKLTSFINGAMFTGVSGGATGIIGLMDAIGSTTNTYAGIDRSVSGNAYFRPYVVDPGTPTTITLANIRTDIGAIYDQCGENPDLALCSTDVFNFIGSLFDATRRETREVTTARGKVTLEGGFAGIEFDGVVFLKDKDCTANTIHYLNSNHVVGRYQQPKLPPMDNALADAPANDGFGVLPIGITFEALAQTGDSYKAFGKSYIQLVVDRPNACGTRKNVKVS